MDRLEDFIRNNRSDLEQEGPSEAVWEGVRDKLFAEQKKPAGRGVKMVPMGVVWKMAASFLILLVSVVLVQYYYHKKGEEAQTVAETTGETNNDATLQAYPDFAEAEAFYIAQINERKREIEALKPEKFGLGSEFSGDVAQLDSLYSFLKEELQVNAQNEQIVNAMIENLQMRIEILNQQLIILKQVKSSSQDESAIQL